MIPRTEEEVVSSNKMLVAKFQEVFGKKDRPDDTDPTNDFIIPVIPTFGITISCRTISSSQDQIDGQKNMPLYGGTSYQRSRDMVL